MNNNLYDENSIESLDPLTFTRLRPNVYCGDTTYSTQLLVEILSNAIDEFSLGHGSHIDITVDTANNIIAVRDYGQGFIPNSYRDDGKTILEAAFSVLNTSGKYREDGTYAGTSLGSFGIGAKLANFLSHWLEVTTFRNGESEHIKFVEGEIFERTSPSPSEENGTYVVWQPNEEFFTHPEIEIDKVQELLSTLVCLCQGLTINLTIDKKKKVYKSENGLNDLVDQQTAGKEIIKNRFNMKFEDGKYKGDLVLTYTSNFSSTIVAYVNSGLTESGQHITQLKATITRELNKFLKQKRWLKDNDSLTGEDIQEGIYIIFNLTAPNVGYDSQIKTRITKIDTKPFMQAFTQEFDSWLNINEKEIKSIADKAINAKKAREAARKARESIRATQKKKKEKVLKFDTQLADCYSKDRQKCEIIICEGKSAAGNLKAARDNQFQAVMSIRGKLLNTEKASLEKIQKNAEIMTMIDAFGLQVDLKTMKLTYKPEDLRYGKIIIMSDADVDGSHIKNLFYTFIWNFCPQLIIDGYIYAGVPPLYKITTSKGYQYLKNDAALTEYQTVNKGKKYQITRLKGLGELSMEETEETLLDPAQRILKQITANDLDGTDILFEQLMGIASVPRKRFIMSHSQEAQFAN